MAAPQISEHKNLTPKAVIYARISSVAQAQKGHGLASQETRCREFAKMKRYEIIEVFHDRAVSGGMIDRPGMQAMLSFLKEQKHDVQPVVLIDDISRLARDIEAHLQLRRAIDGAGAKLESPSLEFGEDSDSRLVENMLASVSQHQRQKNAEQTKNRMRARLMNGYALHAPVGYKFEKQAGRGKVLVRDEPLASIIEEGLKGYASGRFQLQSEVARFFENHDVFPKNRYGEVTNEAANRILIRFQYAGMVGSPDKGVSIREGHHDGLITYETYLKIQSRLKEGAKVPARADISDDFPLRGFVACGCCNKPLTANWSKSKTGKKHPYYMCFNKDCDDYRKSIRRAQVEGDFQQLLIRMRPSTAVFDVAKAMFADAWEQRRRQTQAFADHARRELSKVETKIEHLLDRIVDAPTDQVMAAYEKRLSKLESDKLLLAEKAAKQGQPTRPFRDVFELAMSFLANPCILWEKGGIAGRHTVLKLAFMQKLAYRRNEGFRTPQVSVPFALFGIHEKESLMADRAGFEPAGRVNAHTLSKRAP